MDMHCIAVWSTSKLTTNIANGSVFSLDSKTKKEIRHRDLSPLISSFYRYFFWYQSMNWISRKIYLYNVTFGLYMLDWWERYLFNILMLVLLWFIFYNGSRSMAEFYRSFSQFRIGIQSPKT
ncbi:hypothetical protein MRB53_029609 [Persea americana]|uniref:Uncharacterized protein n=1 Tax=Persea americana TaxID=3435 RepID=A0ACC2KIV1_PERAE|nr:hypothetical protein MRB53_029609 [Persea americana]